VKLTEQLIPDAGTAGRLERNSFETIKANYPGWEAWRIIEGCWQPDGGVTGMVRKRVRTDRDLRIMRSCCPG